MNKLMTATAVAMALSLSACSSIVSKSDYSVKVTSDPTGATYSATNEAGKVIVSGVTPDVVTLSASAGFFNGETYTFSYQMDGHKSQEIVLDSTIDGWYFGNLLIGGWLGFLIIDPLTGAMWRLPTEVNGSMNTLTIKPLSSLTDHEKDQLVEIKGSNNS